MFIELLSHTGAGPSTNGWRERHLATVLPGLAETPIHRLHQFHGFVFRPAVSCNSRRVSGSSTCNTGPRLLVPSAMTYCGTVWRALR